jgi:hypothetical protein
MIASPSPVVLTFYLDPGVEPSECFILSNKILDSIRATVRLLRLAACSNHFEASASICANSPTFRAPTGVFIRRGRFRGFFSRGLFLNNSSSGTAGSLLLLALQQGWKDKTT